jgi:hypothetical protein
MAFTDQELAQIKFASISLAATGTLVPAVTGKKIRVISYVIVAASAVSVNFENGTTNISGVMDLAANSGIDYVGSRDAPAFETSSAALLGLTLSGAVQVSGHLTYVEIPA